MGECRGLEVNVEGVVGIRKSWFSTVCEKDFNEYRTRGHQGRFVSGTNDRAVTLMTVSAYEALRQTLPDATIRDGDLGENLLITGAALDGGVDLDVGTRLQIGEQVQIEITEANQPCFRLGYVSWTETAEKVTGQKK